MLGPDVVNIEPFLPLITWFVLGVIAIGAFAVYVLTSDWND